MNEKERRLKIFIYTNINRWMVCFGRFWPVMRQTRGMIRQKQDIHDLWECILRTAGTAGVSVPWLWEIFWLIRKMFLF